MRSSLAGFGEWTETVSSVQCIEMWRIPYPFFVTSFIATNRIPYPISIITVPPVPQLCYPMKTEYVQPQKHHSIKVHPNTRGQIAAQWNNIIASSIRLPSRPATHDDPGAKTVLTR